MDDTRGSTEGETRSIPETQTVSMLDPDERVSDGYDICDRFSLLIQNQKRTSRDEVGVKLTTQCVQVQVINSASSNTRVCYNNSSIGVGIPIDLYGSRGEPLPDVEQNSLTVPTSSPNSLLYASTSLSGSTHRTDDTPLDSGRNSYSGMQVFPHMNVAHVLNGEVVHLRIADAFRYYVTSRRVNLGGSSRDTMAALKSLEFSLVPGHGDRPFDNSDRHHVNLLDHASTPERSATVTESTEGFQIDTNGWCDPVQERYEQEYVNVDRQMNNEKYSCACLSAIEEEAQHALTPGRVAFFYNHALRRQAFVGKIICVYSDIDMDAIITRKGVARRGDYLLVIAMTLVDGLWCFDEQKLHVQVIHKGKIDHGILWLAAKCCPLRMSAHADEPSLYRHDSDQRRALERLQKERRSTPDGCGAGIEHPRDGSRASTTSTSTRYSPLSSDEDNEESKDSTDGPRAETANSLGESDDNLPLYSPASSDEQTSVTDMIAYVRRTINKHKRLLAVHQATLTKLLAKEGQEPDAQSSDDDDSAAASTLQANDAAGSGAGLRPVSNTGTGPSQVTTAHSNPRQPKPCVHLGLGLRTGTRGRGGGVARCSFWPRCS
jgi:hypothetical protein